MQHAACNVRHTTQRVARKVKNPRQLSQMPGTALRDSITLAIGTVLPSTHRVAFAQVPQTAVSVGGGRDQVRRVGREDSLPHLPPCVSAQSTHVRTQITVRVLSRTRSPSHTTNGAEQRIRCNCTVITTTDGHRRPCALTLTEEFTDVPRVCPCEYWSAHSRCRAH
jgi:hypothetical protein